MSRTTRRLPFWVKDYLSRYPEDYDPRNSLHNGYDGKPHSALIIEGWKESHSGIGGRRYHKKEFRRARRRNGIKELRENIRDSE